MQHLRRAGVAMVVVSTLAPWPRLPRRRRCQRRPRQPGRLREPGQLHAARDERLGQRDHPDRQQDRRGRDVHLGEPVRAPFGNTGDDVVRNRIFAFDATTGAIDPAFNPNLGGAANSLDTDGTYVYVGGSFGSVGGNSAIKRVVKLTAAGAVVGAFNAVPNKVVNEVVVRGSRLYVGGAFTSVRSGAVTTTRNALAALDSDDRRRPLRGQRAVRRASTTPALGGHDQHQALRRLPRRHAARRDRQLRDRRRPAARPDGGPRRRRRRRVGRAVGHEPLRRGAQQLRLGVRHLHARRRLLPGRLLLRRHDHGRLRRRRRQRTLCDTTTRWETAEHRQRPDLGGLHRRRHDVRRRGHRQRRLRRRPHALAEQPVPGRPGRPGRGAARGHRRPRPGQRPPAVVEPRPRARRRRPGDVRDQPGALGRQRHHQDRRRDPRPDRVHAARRRHHDPRRAGRRRCPTTSSSPSRRPAASSSAGRSTPAGRPPARPARRTRRSTGPRCAARSCSTARSTTASATATFNKRTFDKATGATGAQVAVNLRNDPDNGTRIPFAIATTTGMFYDPATHRIYYTVSGDSRLFYRYFTPESEIVGAQTFQADAGGVELRHRGRDDAGVGTDPLRVLHRRRAAQRAVLGRPGHRRGTVVSSDGTWRYRAILVPNS